MAAPESLTIVRTRIGERIAEIERRMPQLEARTMDRKMNAIRLRAAESGSPAAGVRIH